MIKLENLRVELGDFTLHDVSLQINEGEYFIILGPTGAGKTVLLESIAGLNRVKQGNVLLRGRDVTTLEPEKRGIGIVYQDCALFPHLSVRNNILFGLRLRKRPQAEIEEALAWIAGLLDIGSLLDRRPATLSGGEMQKSALARALVTRPEVLLLDEPLGALDPQTRERMQDELRRLQAALGITVIHVTHDFEEAMSLGSRIAVIGEGQVKQVGRPNDIFRRPASEFVARFGMARNIFAGEVLQKSGHKIFRSGGLELEINGNTADGQHAAIRPEDIAISPEPLSPRGSNVYSGMITGISDRGPLIYITLSLPPDIVCMVTRNMYEAMKPVPGQRAFVSFGPDAVHVFP